MAFSAGIGFGVFNLDFSSMSLTNAVATVDDTAFPDVEIINTTVSTSSDVSDAVYNTSGGSSSNDGSSSQQPDSGSGSGDSNGGNANGGSSGGGSSSPESTGSLN
jgi:hypothetical protein